MNLEVGKLRDNKAKEMQMVSSLEVAEMVRREHKNVMRDLHKLWDQLDELNFERNDYFTHSTYVDSLNRIKQNFNLSKKGCELYATRMTGIEGTAFAIRYIERFNEMEAEIKPKLPGSYAEALMELAHTVQHNEELEKQRLLDAPKVKLAESISDSDSTILIRELAKIVKQSGVDMGEKRLYQWLRENGYLIKRLGTDYNMPTQRSMDLGLFRIKESTFTDSKGSQISKTSKVTGKGQQYFINKLLC